MAVLFAALILLPRAERLEIKLMEQDLRRFAHRVDGTVEEVKAQGMGYAAWSDTYAFADDHNMKYVETNFIAGTFGTTGIDVFAVWDRDHALIAGRMLDPESEESVPIAPEMEEELTRLVRQRDVPARGAQSGIVRLASGLWAVALLPVVKDDFTGEPRGTLIAAAELSGERVSAIVAHETFSVELGPPEAGAVIDAIATRPIDDAAFSGRTVLGGLDGQPAVAVEASADRTLYRQQRQGVWIMLLAVALGSVGVSLAIWWAMEHFLLRRLENVRHMVCTVETTGRVDELSMFPGVDEVAELARATGSMATHLQQARNAAEAADRAKSQFLATMSHEIRTPLNGVLGFASLLRATSHTAEQKELIDAIESGSNTLLGLISGILDLSKMEAGRLDLESAPVDVRKAVEVVHQMFGAQLRAKGLAWQVTFAPGTPEFVLTDPLRLRQVLLNLVGNALKFTITGSIRVDVAPRADSDVPGSVCLEFRIADTGIGMDTAQLARLFQPFRQADSTTTRKFGGTGLGLAICARLVEAMGGKISAESEPGRGSVFAFSIRAVPCANPAPACSAPQEAHQSVELGGLRILVAEDNSVNRRMIELMLRRIGCRAEFAETGASALFMLKQGMFDICFMDVQMPEMDGHEAARVYRAWERESDRPPLPIIAVTANALTGDRDGCFDAGMSGFLSKPVKIEDLRAALEVVAEQRAGVTIG